MTDAHPLSQRLAAEFFGTFGLVFGGCGAAVLAAGVPGRRHRLPRRRPRLRPHRADDGLRRRPRQRRPLQPGHHPRPRARAAGSSWTDVLPYVVTQVVAAIAAAAVLFVVANGKSGFDAERLRLRHQRVRRPLTGRLLAAGRAS